MIASNLRAIQERVTAAARAAGRDPGSVSLLAVSKTYPPEAVREAYAAGQRAFGENYAQALRDKAQALADLPALALHAIGPLQTNKAKYIAQSAAAFHALDRLGLAQELSKRCVALGRVLPCFVEVNLGREAQKGGVAPEGLDALVDAAAELPGISLVGLMCIPPPTDDPQGARPSFERLRALRDERLGRHPSLTGLSMGMSHDFEVAIAAGATVVRVGTAIFGARARAPGT